MEERETSRHVPWAVVGQIGPAIVGYLGFFYMLGSLSPADYGLFAIASLAVAALASFGDLGLGVALLRLPEVSRELVVGSLRWTLITGLVLAGVGWASSAVVTALGSEQLALYLALLSFRLVLDGCTYIPTDVAQRQLRFRFLIVRDTVAAAVGAVAGVATTFTTYAEWCLVAAALTQAFAAAAAAPWALRGLGELPVSLDATVRSLVPFARKITYQQVFKFLTQSLDSIAVGTLLGNVALGQYRIAQRLGIETSSMLRVGIGSLLLPELVSGSSARLAPTVQRLQRALLAVAGPLAVLLGLTSLPLIQVVLGDQWTGAAALLTLMSVAAGLQTYLLTVGEVMKFTGHAGWLLTWTIGLTMLTTATLTVGALWNGVTGVAVAYLLTYVVALPLGLLIQRRLCGLGLWDALSTTGGVLGALAVLALVVVGFREFRDLSQPLTLASCWVTGIVAYIIVLLVLDRPILRYLAGKGA